LSATPQRGRTPFLTPILELWKIADGAAILVQLLGEKATMSPVHQLSLSSAAVALLSLTGALWPTSALAGNTNDNSEGYKLREDIPVSCLNRTM
jgi:hypothetical protein